MIQTFGDIFRFREEFYVFLAASSEEIFAAKILDHENSRILESISKRSSDKPLYWYVILTTDEFKDRAAHLMKTQQDIGIEPLLDWVGGSLNETDLKDLKSEIMKDGSPVPKGLKKILSQYE
ncbi:MAG: hypothetical protein NUV54_00605 [Candidatus Taylorbacteria bacterium]|nr:hypothetical protein [Candidatus Taylorbacteria bacterium]